MPIYDSSHIEYTIDSGFVRLNLDNGEQIPAYWAYPQLGGKYPAIALLHDWWGVTAVVRRLADSFAQGGYYVIVPDLFDERIAETPKDAIALVEGLGERNGLARIYAAIDVVEQHHQTNRTTAVIGLGMGGSFAFDMAVDRGDVEAAVAFGGFPQRNFGRFKTCKTPLLALYGKQDPHIAPPVLERLKRELAESVLAAQHSVQTVEDLAHDFFADTFDPAQQQASRAALKIAIDFIDRYLTMPQRPARKVY